MILRLLSLATTIIVSCPGKKSFASALAFRPTPPPRFDVFSERLVGSWKTNNDDQIVEEVMRSCGGAVQGLREPIPNDNDDDEPIYLNRANDGFVFFDNGCYTYGPLKRNGDDQDDYLHSLMVGNSKSRVVVFGKEEKSSFLLEWKKAGTLFDENPPNIEMEQSPHELMVDFVETIICSKTSAMQPWMLQRAKWQKEISEEATKKREDSEEPSSLNDCTIRCWSLTQPAPEFFEWMSSSAESQEGEMVVQVGTLCEATGAVNLVARHYDTSNDLKQVLFAEGILQSG